MSKLINIYIYKGELNINECKLYLYLKYLAWNNLTCSHYRHSHHPCCPHISPGDEIKYAWRYQCCKNGRVLGDEFMEVYYNVSLICICLNFSILKVKNVAKLDTYTYTNAYLSKISWRLHEELSVLERCQS